VWYLSDWSDIVASPALPLQHSTGSLSDGGDGGFLANSECPPWPNTKSVVGVNSSAVTPAVVADPSFNFFVVEVVVLPAIFGGVWSSWELSSASVLLFGVWVNICLGVWVNICLGVWVNICLGVWGNIAASPPEMAITTYT
jgi:hypothetical protein